MKLVNKEISFTIPGKTVSKSNQYRISAKGKFPFLYKTQQTKDYEALSIPIIEDEIKLQGWIRATGPVRVYIFVNYNDLRARDLDNTFKIILDLMNERIYEDDNQVFEIIAKKTIDKTSDPFAKVTVVEISDALNTKKIK